MAHPKNAEPRFKYTTKNDFVKIKIYQQLHNIIKINELNESF